MSDPDGFYKVLGVPPGSSVDVIKKAWCKLQKQYNPDLGSLVRQAKQTITDPEKLKLRLKEISDFCCKMNEAKEYLCDSEKKARYDQGIGKEGYSISADDFGGIGSIFDLFNGHFRQSRGSRVRKVEDTTFDVNISLKECFTGKTSKFKVKRKVICKNCSGKGGENVIKCTNCNGKGNVRVRQRMGNTTFIRDAPCDSCKGLGEIIKGNKCNVCTGKKMIIDETIIDIEIKPGVKDNTVIKIEKMGDEAEGFVTGDLVCIIKIKQEPVGKYLLRRVNDDLFGEIKIGLFEALVGLCIEFETIDERKLQINIPKMTNLKESIVIQNEGFKNDYGRGNLILKPEYIIPENLDDNLIKNTFNIKTKKIENKKGYEIKDAHHEIITEKEEIQEESEENNGIRFGGYSFF